MKCHHFCYALHTLPVWLLLFFEIFIKAQYLKILSVDIVLIGTYRNDVAQSSIWLIVPCSLLSMRLYTLLAVILRHLSTGGPTSNGWMDMREGYRWSMLNRAAVAICNGWKEEFRLSLFFLFYFSMWSWKIKRLQIMAGSL